jgi:DNA-binding IscR family transcriptional regulator/predicted nucleotidyltransferase
MKDSEINVFLALEEGKTAKEIAKALKVSKQFVLRVLRELEGRKIVEKKKEGRKIVYYVSQNLKAPSMLKVLKMNREILKGKREFLLPLLLEEKSFREVQFELNVSTKKLIEDLKFLMSIGVVKKNEKYSLNEEKKEIVELARILALEKEKFEWKRGEEFLKVSEKEEPLALTAFNLFSNYGVDILTNKFYYYHPKKELSLEEIFIHSLVFSKTKQEVFLAIVFFLKNKENFDFEKLFQLAKKFNVKDLLMKIIDYSNGKEVKDERFLSLEEFNEKAKVYGIEIKRMSSSKSEIENLLKKIDEELKEKIEVYIIGGANLVLRGLKISTKDIDLIVEKKYYETLKNALISLGFTFSNNIFEKEKYRVDVFVERVMNGYCLSERMKKDREKIFEFKNLTAYLLPLEYIFLFKSYSSREIDVEDCKAIAEKGIDWKKVLEECLKQEEELGKLFSITLFDMVNELKKFGIRVPIEKKLIRHCDRKMIEISLSKGKKTVNELVKELNIPESTIRKILKELEK